MHVLQGYMGHTKIETTSRYYLAASDAHAERVRQAFARGEAELKTDAKLVVGTEEPAKVDRKPPCSYATAI